ncbi:MAG TPA: VWA domain-containing protein [Candidatus Acidoferrum sp.]|nr:VWA domain-containing protein [Candidatus Acidoferrum sp.]
MPTPWRKTLYLSALVLFAALLFQIAVPLRSQDEGVVRVNVKLVMVDATVKTKAGAIMSDLKKGDFEIREDGVPQKIEVFSRDELPLNVALVLDLSDSIGPFLGPLRDAANTALAALKPDDQVALFTFSTEAEMRVPLTKDKAKIAEMISTFQARGATNINDGIFVAAQYLLRSPNRGRRVIILISDDVGTSAGGQGTRDIVTECIAADTVLYNLKIPGDNPAGTLLYASTVPGLVEIHKVMDQTGGELFDVKNVANLDDAFRALIARIKTRYTIGYYTKASGVEGKPHKLDVTLASSFGKKGHDYNIMAKNSFYVH